MILALVALWRPALFDGFKQAAN